MVETFVETNEFEVARVDEIPTLRTVRTRTKRVDAGVGVVL